MATNTVRVSPAGEAFVNDKLVTSDPELYELLVREGMTTRGCEFKLGGEWGPGENWTETLDYDDEVVLKVDARGFYVDGELTSDLARVVAAVKRWAQTCAEEN